MITDIASKIAAATEIEVQTIADLIEIPKDSSHGDFAFPCFILAKTLKKSPQDCAVALSEKLDLPESVEKAEVVGPYLNFFRAKEPFIDKVLNQIFNPDNKKQQDLSSRTILVEYSSPNIAKEFHVGHLRTTLIGLSLDRIFRHLGYNIKSINHLGDWGTQFGFVYAGCQIWGKLENPTVDSLVDVYIKATSLRKQQENETIPEEDLDKPDVNQMARDYFIRLEAGEKEALDFWQWCLDISMTYFKASYGRLGISFDFYTGESFYRDRLKEVEESIKASGTLEESQGALGVDLGKKLGFARVFTADGRSLYITRDIACADYRNKTFNPEKILYVVAASQALHFQHLVGILKKMNHPVADKIQHVAFGYVPGMKTREGGAISLKNYLAEAHDRALTTYQQEVSKRPEGLDENEIAEKVAIGATYFYFLSHSNIKDFQFSWKEALNFQGDSGPYIQYALARINSILANAKKEGLNAQQKVDPILLNDDASYALINLLDQFDNKVERVAESYDPYHLALYLLDIAREFSKAYKHLRVLGEEKRLAEARLTLFSATKQILSTGMYLLGIPTVERM